MPPIRTTKKNTCSAAQTAVATLPLRIQGAVSKGVRDARFSSSEYDWAGKYERVIGTSTRNIFFGSNFVLTDDHIDDILALGNLVCRNITQFIFIYENVSYDAQNNAQGLTNGAVIRLAKACPNLTKVHLPGTSVVTDDGLLGLLENCPRLSSVELTGTSRGSWHGLAGKALIELRENPEWAPNLRKLVLGERENNKPFMKAMRSLTKGRTGLTVTLLQRHEVKKWGDWELEEIKIHYKKGRILSIW